MNKIQRKMTKSQRAVCNAHKSKSIAWRSLLNIAMACPNHTANCKMFQVQLSFAKRIFKIYEFQFLVLRYRSQQYKIVRRMVGWSIKFVQWPQHRWWNETWNNNPHRYKRKRVCPFFDFVADFFIEQCNFRSFRSCENELELKNDWTEKMKR